MPRSCPIPTRESQRAPGCGGHAAARAGTEAKIVGAPPVTQRRTCIEGQIALGSDRALIELEIAAGGETEVTPAEEISVRIRQCDLNVCTGHVEITRGAHSTTQLDTTIGGVDREVIRQSGQIAGHTYAGALLGNQQPDPVRVHTPEATRIDCKLGRRTARGNARTRAGCVVELVG